MSTMPPVSDPRFDGDYYEPAVPKKKRSVWATCLIGCLIMALVALVLGVALVFWIVRNARSWTADIATQVINQGIDASRLPQQEKDEIKVQTDRVLAAFRQGRLSGEQITLITDKIVKSQLLTTLVVAAIEASYLEMSGLTDEEKTAANETLQRFLRGMMDDKFNKAATDRVMSHVAVQQADGNWQLREQVSDADLRAFLAAAKAEADEADIAPPPTDFDPSEEFQQIIDEVMGESTDAGPKQAEAPEVEAPPVERPLLPESDK